MGSKNVTLKPSAAAAGFGFPTRCWAPLQGPVPTHGKLVLDEVLDEVLDAAEVRGMFVPSEVAEELVLCHGSSLAPCQV